MPLGPLRMATRMTAMQASSTTTASNELDEFFNEHVGEPSRPRLAQAGGASLWRPPRYPLGGFATLRGVGCVVRSVPRKGHGRSFFVLERW